MSQRQGRTRKRPQPSLFEDLEPSPDERLDSVIEHDDDPTMQAVHQRAIDEAKAAARRRLFEEISAKAEKGERFHGWCVDKADDDAVAFYKLRVRDRLVQIDRAVVVASDARLTLSASGRPFPSKTYTNADGTLFTGLDGLKFFLDFVAGLRLRKLFAKRVQTPIRCRSAGVNDDAALAKLLRRKVIRATVRRERMKQELRAIKKEVQNVSRHMVDRVLELLPSDQRASVTAALRQGE
ncbi:hypothetical protein MRX96_009584 [Rhipicephalus microplus]